MLAHTSADVIPSERSESRDLWNTKPALTHLSTDPSTRCLWHLPRDDIAEGRFPRNERWDSPARQEPIAQGRDISRPYTSQAPGTRCDKISEPLKGRLIGSDGYASIAAFATFAALARVYPPPVVDDLVHGAVELFIDGFARRVGVVPGDDLLSAL